jgi:hypothetical protein
MGEWRCEYCLARLTGNPSDTCPYCAQAESENEMTPDEIYNCQHKTLTGPTPAMMEDGDWRNVCRDCLKAVSMETCCVCKRTVERGLTVLYLNGAVCDFCLDHNEERWD